MPAAPPRESRIVDLLERLGALLDCADDSQLEMLGKRRSWASNTRRELADAKTQAQFLGLCREIQKALRGGMGSFGDVYLYSGADCEFDEAELNATFLSVIEEIFSATTQAIDRGSAPT